MKLILAIALLAIAAALAFAFAGAALERRPGTAPGPIVLPMPRVQAVAAVRRLLREKVQPPNPAFRSFATAAVGEAIFPSDDLLRATLHDNPPLRAYVDIPPAERGDDLYFFEATGDRYWPSAEFSQRGQPVPFRCAFLVHLSAAGAGETRVDAFEYQPAVKPGKRLGLGAHGPGYFDDVRPAAPTETDRAQLLEWIATASRPG